MSETVKVIKFDPCIVHAESGATHKLLMDSLLSQRRTSKLVLPKQSIFRDEFKLHEYQA